MSTPTPRTDAESFYTAEVKRLKRDYEYEHKCLYEVRGRCELWKQRAMKAEADLAAAKERLRSEAMDDYASIKNLQRELAAERARVKKLSESSNAQLSLICGELTASEFRTIRAVLGFILRNPEKNIEEVNEN